MHTALVTGGSAGLGLALTRALAEVWRPHRGAAAIFAWHSYQTTVI